ncbi:MAG: type I restriction endonuclease [Cyanobacteria bacterium P01_G01_bin.54]
MMPITTLPAQTLSLAAVEAKLGLMQVEEVDIDPLAWFPEWQGELPQLPEAQRQILDNAKRQFRYLLKYPLNEETVKLVVLSPLLAVAGFYEPPFRIASEPPVELMVEDGEQLIRGKIDVLVLHQALWVLVIESKRKQLNVIEALPQALTYMMANPDLEQPRFGLITNGSEFIFIKLAQAEAWRYGFSKMFSLFNPGNELSEVCGVLRVLGRRAIAP